MSRWYKCDLQVATPAWGFKLPHGRSFDFTDPGDRAEFADLYMAALKERGVEVIALAEHHTADWLDDMKAAGERAGITVFPGVEVTTGTGSDGVHLVLIGNLDTTAEQIRRMLATCCGFDDDYPPYNPTTRQPAGAPKSIPQILKALPQKWLVLAPHALGDNGIASMKSVRGSIRWQALHDSRLSAIDVGHPSDDGKSADRSWNKSFRRRALKDFPGLARLAYVSTSDAYKLDDLGRRFTWIRMAEPSLEGLRQAFLDFDARILCDWDERLDKMPDRDPNRVQHGWVEAIVLDGVLGNSAEPLHLDFTPGLNVLIGGRGAGKSTALSSIRQLYGDVTDLPERLRAEGEDFRERVFGQADLTAVHHLPVSGESQVALWTKAGGKKTLRGDQLTSTAFPVRVYGQKELFERVAPNPDDEYCASRHLLRLVDEALDASGVASIAVVSADQSRAANAWQRAVTERLQTETELAQLPHFQARAAELRRQVEHLDNPLTKQRRLKNEQILRDHEAVESAAGKLGEAIIELEREVNRLLQPEMTPAETEDSPIGPGGHHGELARIRTTMRAAMLETIAHASSDAETAAAARRSGEWAEQVRRARHDDEAYQAELVELGVDAQQYLSLREELATTLRRIDRLETLAQGLPEQYVAEASAGQALDLLGAARRQRRLHLLGAVAERSGSLRFEIRAQADWTGWMRAARDLLSLRLDGYIEEVRTLARWLWDGPPETLGARLSTWRDALISNDYSVLAGELSTRGSWWTRLQKFDQAVRLRLCTLMADDVVTMRFLRNGGDPSQADDWQEVIHGSPGQRSAAMLTFVLHQGEEPLILDQPEDDLDTSMISELIVAELRKSRWTRQIIVATHNANIPVLGDADRVIVLENTAHAIRVRNTSRPHVGSIDVGEVRKDIQNVMEGGVKAFVMRERKYDNELSRYRQDAADLVSARGAHHRS